MDPVRTRPARRAVAVVRPQVGAVDDTGLPKDGASSFRGQAAFRHPGQGREPPTGGSAHAALDTAARPMSWRLPLTGSWDGPEAAGLRPLPHLSTPP
ncbi:transposase [Streptomyces sp. NPDC019224]|uniref:transposase n=1 Tax=Streptomyces sp. NPDC019224 TaxID=3154484 RepID=UPI0033EACE2E